MKQNEKNTRPSDTAPQLFAEVLLPLYTGPYTYMVPGELSSLVEEGRLVTVPLGTSKIYTGVVLNVHDRPPAYKNVRAVISVAADIPPVSPLKIRLWRWVADYYMSTPGEVMRVALPPALKPSGSSEGQVKDRSYARPRENYLRLGESLRDQASLNDAFEKLRRRASLQYDALIEIVDLLGTEKLFSGAVPRRLVGCGAEVLARLVKKGLIAIESREVTEVGEDDLPPVLPVLSPAQQKALAEVRAGFEDKDTVLLHGITGSGKTEIYIHLIDSTLRAGRDVLYLLPEIAMSSQAVARLGRYFGSRVIPYHSSYSERKKGESYLRASAGEGARIVMGVRSSVFLPGANLGLVIVDEEHDPSYKNQETSPRYNARDTAMILAGMTGGRTLLGSATPSLETYANALAGKYGHVELTERYGDAVLPRIVVSDTIRSVKRGERTSHFNKLLLDSIASALGAGRQMMLFQNRRGFSPYVECGECGWTASCPNCNVTLTFHKSQRNLRCHYCGHTAAHPSVCPACSLPAVDPKGFGTEKIEEELSALFPAARIERLDRDTATSATRFEAIISDFEKGRTDILVGTQMITKGFDFEGVSLVGILNADNLLAYPDFRASERAFQLLTQVAGRAGRRREEGLVVIQTSQPTHPVIVQAASGDYRAMASGQLAERRSFFYPPYCRMLIVRLRHRDRQTTQGAAAELAARMRTVFGRRVCGPQPPPVDRVRGEYLETVMLKVERESSFVEAKKIVSGQILAVSGDKRFRAVHITCDVDPL